MRGDNQPSRADFEQLALAQLDTLFRVARRLVRDPAGAEDLVQETYLRAFRAADRFKLEEFGIRPWLLRIMQNLYLSRSQRESKQPRAIDGEQLALVAGPVQAENSSRLSEPPSGDQAQADALAATRPVDSALFDSLDEKLASALEDLQPEYRQVMLMWAVEELSYKEISQALDVPIGTVMSRLYRARQRLADQLRAFAQDQRLIRE